MTTKLTIDNFSDIETTGISWQSVKTSSFTAVAGEGYFCNTTSSAFTITLPSSPSVGDSVAIKDYAGTFASNNLTIARNGENIQGVANDSLISTNRASVTLVYIDSTKGWLYTDEHNVDDLGVPILFITATGGTVTTSGDFKIHSFTGDGSFVVSQIGNSPTVPIGGPTNVDYLVVAGGGGGGGYQGGGGAGGYRTTFPSPGCNAGAFPISATTYPITVGGGGTGGVSQNVGTSGSNSIFSTITSAGGGRGGAVPIIAGANGGSGGGGGTGNGAGGSGNTPPVSPPQGNNGGSGKTDSLTYNGGGGGGGASVAGTNATGTSAPTIVAGPGGSGATNSINGSSVTRAGGGGGGSPNPSGTAGSGGSGGGGAGSINTTATPGTANTGGGGGGGGNATGGSGGKGIIIIRYKFQ